MSILHRNKGKERSTTSVFTESVFAGPFPSQPHPQNPCTSSSHNFTIHDSHGAPQHHQPPKHEVKDIEMTSNPAHARALSPISHNRASAPPSASFTTQKTMDEDSQQGAEYDGNTRDSAISGLSILADDTDTFYQRSMDQLSRDRQRLQHAVDSNSVPAFGAQPQAFRKARPQHRVALTMDNLERNNSVRVDEKVDSAGPSKDALNRRQSVAGGEGLKERSRGASYNLPREWGRKGMQKNDFLMRINSTGGVDKDKEADVEDRGDPDRIYRRRTLYTGDSPLSADLDADTAVEPDSPLSTTKRPTRSTKQSSGQQNTTIEDIMELEREQQEDDTPKDGSPSPAAPRRRHTLERKQREIDNIKERAVTTSRLADVAKKSLRMPGSLAQAFKKAGEAESVVLDHDLGQVNGTSNTNGPNGARLAQSSSTGSLRTSDARRSKDAAPAPAADSTKTAPPRRDSRDLLRRLARASSTTSSPSSDPSPKNAAESLSRHQRALPTSNNPFKREPPSIKYGTLGSQSPEIEKQRKRPSSLFAGVPSRSSSLRSPKASPAKSTNRVSTAYSSTNSSSLRSKRSTPATEDDDPPQLEASPMPKTPTVTGAWVQTPQAQAEEESAQVRQAGLPEKQPHELRRSQPVRKSRSHESVLPRVPRSRRNDLAESTTQATQPESGGLVLANRAADAADAADLPYHLPNLDLTDLALGLDDDTLDLVANVGTPVGARVSHPPRALRPEEADAMARMAQSLRSVKSGLYDASRGIAKVEHEFDAKGTSRALIESRPPRPQQTTTHLCTQCGTHTHPAITSAPTHPTVFHILANTWTALLALLLTRNPTTNRRRLTFLGKLALGLFIYSLLEWRACHLWCHHVTYMYYPTYNPIPLKRPRVPFMMLWYAVLEPTSALWWPLWEGWCWVWWKLGGKEVQWGLWVAMKWIGWDWIMGPGRGLPEDHWAPEWWWNAYGGPYGGGRRYVRRY